MKNLIQIFKKISLVQRIVICLIVGIVLGLTVPNATFISLLGDVFVGALKAIAPLLVFFLVISSLCQSGKSHGGVIKTVIIMYMFSTFLASIVAVIASRIFPITLTLTTSTSDLSAPQGIYEVLKNLLMSIVTNPIESITKANYIGILVWAVLFGISFRHSKDSTKQIFNDIANGLSKVVS